MMPSMSIWLPCCPRVMIPRERSKGGGGEGSCKKRVVPLLISLSKLSVDTFKLSFPILLCSYIFFSLNWHHTWLNLFSGTLTIKRKKKSYIGVGWEKSGIRQYFWPSLLQQVRFLYVFETRSLPCLSTCFQKLHINLIRTASRTVGK